MAGAPIGVTFVPSQDNAEAGSHQGSLTGNVQDAYRMLSLQLPRVVGAKSITPSSNLGGSGSSGLPSSASFGSETGSLSPEAAILRAIFRAMLGGGNPLGGDPMGGGASSGAPASAGLFGFGGPPPVRITPSYDNEGRQRGEDAAGLFNQPSPGDVFGSVVEPQPTVTNDGTFGAAFDASPQDKRGGMPIDKRAIMAFKRGSGY